MSCLGIQKVHENALYRIPVMSLVEQFGGSAVGSDVCSMVPYVPHEAQLRKSTHELRARVPGYMVSMMPAR